jgi:hypothetical protein
MNCQARVLDTIQTFPNTKITYHTTKECEDIAVYKYSVDDGDSEMNLCKDCFRRCLTKKTKNSTWLGFFDCSYPPDAKVKGSSWYFSILSNCQVSEELESEEELCDEMAKCSLSDVEEVAEEVVEEVAEEMEEEVVEEVEEEVIEEVAEEEVVEQVVEAEAEEVAEEAEAEEVAEEAEAEEAVTESPSDKIKMQIAELQKLSRKMTDFTQMKQICKQIIELKTQLNKIK